MHAEPSRRCRPQRIEGHNHARSLTFSCFQNRPFFSSERACQWLVDALIRVRGGHQAHIWAWVVMPTHVHLLVYPVHADHRIGPLLAGIKLSVARRAVAWTRANAPDRMRVMLDESPSGRVVLRFWQRGGGYDRNLFSPDAIRSEIKYIHANPVRAGLCERPDQWKWSSHCEHVGPHSGPPSIDTVHLRAAIGRP